MANGSHKPGPAQADRYREKYRSRGRSLQSKLDAAAPRNLPPYRAEMESEDSTITGPGNISAKLPIPRAGRLAIGFGLCVLFICVGAAIVLRAWR